MMPHKCIAFWVCCICIVSASAQKNVSFAEKTGTVSVPVLDFDAAVDRKETRSLLSRFAEDIEFIPLETTNDCLLDEDFSKVVIDGDDVFVSDYSQLVRFDRKGKIKNKIGRIGQGPGEYKKVWKFSVDTVNKQVYIFDLGFIKRFGYDGKFLGQSRLDGEFWSHRTQWHSPGVMAVNNQYYEFAKSKKKGTRTCMYFYNPLENKIISQMATVQDVMPKGLYICEPSFYSYNKSLFVKDFWSDTIFHAKTPLMLVPHAVVKRDNFRSISDNKVYRDLLTGEVVDRKVLAVDFVFESTRYVFLLSSHGLAVFDKKEKTQWLSEGQTRDKVWSLYRDDLYGQLDFGRLCKEVIQRDGNDYLLAYIHPVSMLGQEPGEHKIQGEQYDRFQTMVKGVGEDDNPILMLIKLKK
ncbi:MAG: 6-bladed beta-propeller [Tannerellaceae bacterium]